MDNSPSKITREQKKTKTRKTIKSVAKKFFNEKGVEATNTREISAKSGVAVGTFFSHFPDKMQLVKELFFEAMDEKLVPRLDHFLDNSDTAPCDFMNDFSAVSFDFYLEHRDYTVLILGQSILESGFFQSQLESMKNSIVTRFQAIGVDETSAQIFSENMIANFQYILFKMLETNSSNKSIWLQRLNQLNLPFDHIYQNALNRFNNEK